MKILLPNKFLNIIAQSQGDPMWSYQMYLMLQVLLVFAYTHSSWQLRQPHCYSTIISYLERGSDLWYHIGGRQARDIFW